MNGMERAPFSYKEDERLIGLIKSYPCIHDTQDAHYKDLHIKERAWKEIVAIMGKSGMYKIGFHFELC